MRALSPVGIALAGLSGPLALVLLSSAPLPADDEGLAGVGRKLPPGHAGIAVCASCHEEQHAALSSSVHAVLLASPGSIGCEDCHGPGGAHAIEFDDPLLIRHPRKLPRVASEALCMTCHGEETWVPDWYRSDWYREGISCVDCHTVHQDKAAIERARPDFPPKRAAAAEAETPPPPAAPFPVAAVAGMAECRACHTGACATFRASPHDVLGRTEPSDGACESCHGPGSFHVESGGVKAQILNPRNAPPPVAGAVCLSCHDRTAHVSGWATSAHRRAGVGCVSCHESAAHPKGREPSQMVSCGECHSDVAAEFRHPNRHRVPEGAMACTDCHNPHESGRILHDKELKLDRCVECHAEKRGPFVYEHNADRVDGCVACHLPHGSINRRLLTHREVRMQCLQCHSNVLPFHDQTPGSEFRNCLACHSEIHGSHIDELYFR